MYKYILTLNENAAAANAVVNGLHRRILVDDVDEDEWEWEEWEWLLPPPPFDRCEWWKSRMEIRREHDGTAITINLEGNESIDKH